MEFNPIDPATLAQPSVCIDSRGYRHVSLPPAERLKNSVPNWGEQGDACWVWTGSTNPKGYGGMSIARHRVLAHRVSYALHYGIDPGPFRVLHACDNPPCVNPAHLSLGTSADNTADMMQKRRGVAPVNEANGRTKITTQQVQEIRDRASAGESYRSIARDIGVHAVTIGNIATYRRRLSVDA